MLAELEVIYDPKYYLCVKANTAITLAKSLDSTGWTEKHH